MDRLSKIFLISILFTLLSTNLSAQKSDDGVIVHLSSSSPHRVVMALSYALKMSEDHPVFVYVDIDGVKTMLKNSISINFENYEPSKILIDKLLKAGVKISVCQMCLEAAGNTKYDLINGLQIAKKSDFFDFTSGRIITIDY